MASPLAEHLDLQVLATGLDHPEGLCWDPTRRCLWAGGEAGQIYRVELDGTVLVVATIDGGALLGVALDGDGRLYCCDTGNHQVWRLETDFTVTPYGGYVDYPNYAAFDEMGRLFVTDSGSFDEATGRLVVIDRDGTMSEVATRPVAFANGLAVRDETLWMVESSAPGVSAMSLGGGPVELVVEMERCVPDGLAFDANGDLLISCYQPNQLWRWSESAGLSLLFDDWSGEYVLTPTNVAFYGEHLERLAMASLGGNSLTSVDVGVAGSALNYPRREEPT